MEPMVNTLTLADYCCRLLAGSTGQSRINALGYALALWLARYDPIEELPRALAEFVISGRLPVFPTIQLLADALWVGSGPSILSDPLPLAPVLDLHSTGTFPRTVPQSHVQTTCTRTARQPSHLPNPTYNIITYTYWICSIAAAIQSFHWNSSGN